MLQTETLAILDYESAYQTSFEGMYRAWFTAQFGMDPEPTDEYVLKQPEAAILEKGGAVLVAFYRGQLAGFVALKPQGTGVYELTKMIVHPDFRGKGLGEALCRAIVARAEAMGAGRVILYTHHSLKDAIKIYHKLGFEEVALEAGIYSPVRCDLKMELWLIQVSPTTHSRPGGMNRGNIEFGKDVTDHMLVCDFGGGHWQTPRILPFGNFSFPPTLLAFHYGQTIFEGMKAFRTHDGRTHIFRPGKHYERLKKSSERLCMPVVPAGIFLRGMNRLIELDRDWIPAGGSLYIRPFIIATEARLGVKISDTYRFTIIASPAGDYFSSPLRVKVEREFVRAVHGGTGYAKCGGNYGAAFYPTQRAKEDGYDQVLWTDGIHHRYVEEMGMMNVFFVVKGKLVTPALTDSLLDGVTRDSLLTLALKSGIIVEERPVSVDELKEGLERGWVQEAFGAGTAAVVSPIHSIGIDGEDYALPIVGMTGPAVHSIESAKSIAIRLKNELDDVRDGSKPDPFGWNSYI